jgi:signal transduction histidine kinase
MRRQILTMTALAVTLAVVLFGVPLGIVARSLINADQRQTLERTALRGAITVSNDALLSADPIELPPTGTDVTLGIYDTDGRLVAGEGPDAPADVIQDPQAADIGDSSTPSEIVVVVPVSDQEHVIAVARAASPRSAVQRRVAETWALMAGAAVAAVAAAIGMAGARVRRLTEPLDRLTQTAEDLGNGNLAARAPHSGVDEIDRTGTALNRTASQLQDLIEHERQFTERASHQLRTPLTGLRLALDSALASHGTDIRDAAREALSVTEDLERTIDDVLAVSRAGSQPSERIDATQVLDDVLRRWRPQLRAASRDLVVEAHDPPVAHASASAVRQILDVLVDNALRHGRGTVTVTARSSSQALAIDVVDQGSTAGRLLVPLASSPDRPSGRIGLRMAQSLADSQDGRLLHDHTAPTTRFTLLLPADVESGPDVDPNKQGHRDADKSGDLEDRSQRRTTGIFQWRPSLTRHR